MPLDPQAQSVVEMLSALGARPLHVMSPGEARQATARLAKLGGRPAPVQRTEDRTVPGPAGPIPVRVYTPPGDGPFPALVYCHGGGWVTGSIATHEPICRALAHGAGCAVVSVDYRLAPEHKFPAAVEDCYAVTRWLADNGAALGIDPARLAVGGDSAGGTLATVVALWARDRGGPALACQLLIYPITDYMPDLPSRLKNGYFLSNADVAWAWKHYLTSAAEAADPSAAPLRAADLTGLPPAIILTAEFDPLHDEGNLYADRLRAAGVPTVLARYDGMIHGFVSLAGVIDQGKAALAQAAGDVRSAFAA
jgi:acetyl esterase/lipase